MRSTQLQLAGLLAFALSVIGCSSHPMVSERDIEPLPYLNGHARSLALTSQAVQANQLLPPGYGAWYESRNDIGPSVFAGYRSERREQTITITRDRQRSFNGRVRDTFQENTYRRTYTESSR